MADKKKKTQVSEEELKAVEGLAGAKGGLALASRMDLLKAKTIAIPIILGSTAAMLLPGKETEKRVKDAIKFVKESQMDKATFVFEKISKKKCKKKKSMVKKAIGPAGIATVALIGGSFAPKPRKTALNIPNPKNPEQTMKFKDMVKLPKK